MGSSSDAPGRPRRDCWSCPNDRHGVSRRAALTKESEVIKQIGLTEPEGGIRLPFIQPDAGRGWPVPQPDAARRMPSQPEPGWRLPFTAESALRNPFIQPDGGKGWPSADPEGGIRLPR